MEIGVVSWRNAPNLALFQLGLPAGQGYYRKKTCKRISPEVCFKGMIFLRNYYVNTTAKTDVLLITHDVKRAVRESGLMSGILTVLVPGSTAGLALLENDPKIHEDLKNWVETQVPAETGPRPNRRSGSGRNSAHLRAALLGVSVGIPLMDGKLMMGAWQEVVLFDFDDSKVGRREITVQIVGEGPAK